MAAYRPARSDVKTAASFPSDVRGTNFYVLMDALYRQSGEADREPSLRTEPGAEVALFQSDASIAFPASDLSRLDRNDAGQFRLTTKFLGFSGSQSPLPGYYLDRMARESAQNEDGLAAFLDLFSHRWTQFAYHAWRRYRYYICFRNGGTDTFSQRMYALVGLGNKNVRDRLAINHSKMLAYAGILATPGRSPDVVCSLVSHCFELPDVTIENWQQRKVTIDPSQQNRLGVRNPKTKSAGYVPGRSVSHTDWHAKRATGDGDAISRWTPYDRSVIAAQKELSKLPVYQRVYQSLKTRALGVLPADLNLRDHIGPTFEQVFISADDNKLVIPQFLTRYGLQRYFVTQRDALVELTAMDSWVLNQTRSVKYSDADRAEIQRQLTEQYISDYTATWRAGMDNLNVRDYDSIAQLTGALEQVISGDLPLQRALTALRDNTQSMALPEKLSDKEREAAQAEADARLLTRQGREFAPENSTLVVQKDKESTMQVVYQQLTELHRYLLAIQNAPVPGKSALKAVQLRLDQNSSDPIFTTRQMAKTLSAPLNRWVSKLADQAWHVVMVEAVRYMEVDWRDNVVKPFSEQLAGNYPFAPRAQQDASLDAFERFFKPDGVLDAFYQQNLKLFIENDLSRDGDDGVIIREDVIQQLNTAQKIRDIFFSKQNGLGTQFAVETVSLSGNKRRSVLNLDGQLIDYSQGRNHTAHLVWPNNMREGNESKLTLVGTDGRAPRSISFNGPWAQFRLFGAGQLTGVEDGTFSVRFSVDGGAMVYRVHTDTEDNPFAGGLFSQFQLPDTLY